MEKVSTRPRMFRAVMVNFGLDKDSVIIVTGHASVNVLVQTEH